MPDDRIDVVLRLTTEFQNSGIYDELSKDVRALIADSGRLEIALRKVEEAEQNQKDGLELLSQAKKAGKMNDDQITEATKVFADAVYAKAVPALAAYNKVLLDVEATVKRLNTSPLSAEAITPAERTGAANFKSNNLPALKEELNAIKDLNNAMAEAIEYDKIFEQEGAKAFKNNELPYLKEEIAGIEARNKAMADAIAYAESYDLVQAKRNAIYAPQIKEDIAAIEQEAASLKQLNQQHLAQYDAMQNVEGESKKLNISFAQLATTYYFLRSLGAGLVESTKRVLDFITATNALSQVLGVSSQQAAGFVFQAEELGVSVDTVTEAYRTFSDRLGRATGLFGEQNRSSKQMSEAMKSLGINVLDASGHVRSMGEIIPEVADAIQKLGPGIETTAIATALFGQRSDELIPGLLKGAEGLRHAAEMAEKLGFNLTHVETRQLRDATVATNDLQKAMDALFLDVAKGLAPMLPGLAKDIVDIVGFIGDAFVQTSGDIIHLEGIMIGFGVATADLLNSIAAGNLDFLTKSREHFKIATDIANEEEANFAKGRGYVLDKSTGLVSRDPNADKTGDVTNGIPGPDDATQQKIDDLLKRKQDLIDSYNLDEQKRTRDFQISQQRAEDDFRKDRIQQYTDYLRERAKKTQDFNAGQLAELAKFNADQKQRDDEFAQSESDAITQFADDWSQKLADFNAKQNQDSRDFNLEQARKLSDFNESQNEKLEDYQIQRARLVEDANSKQQDLAQKHADALVAIQQKAQDDMEALLARWDEITLRLSIGGDQDSIILAAQKRQEAIDKQNADTQAKIDAENAAANADVQGAADDTELRLKRLDEDFKREQARRQQDYEETDARRKKDFATQLADDAAKFEADKVQAEIEFKYKDGIRKRNFEADKQQRAEDFAAKQQDDKDHFDLELKRDADEETIKLQRQLEDRETTRQRAIDDFNKDTQDRADKFAAELADINQQLDEICNAKTTSYQTCEDILTDITAKGVEARNAIRQNERDAWWLDAASAGSGGHENPVSRAFVGIVPGPLGMPRSILAHGGERVVPPPSSNYYSNVRYGDQFSQRNVLNFTANGGGANSVAKETMSQVGRMFRLNRAMNGAS